MTTMMLIALIFFKLVFPEEALSLQEKLFIANYYYNTEWKYTMCDNGIGLSERWLMVSDSMGVRERRGDMIISCDYNRAINYLSDYKNINQWMKRVKSATLLADTDRTIHLVFAMPWPMSNRDVVATLNLFPVDNNSCIVKICSLTEAPQQHGNVRIGRYQTTIHVTRLDDERTKIELSTFTNEPPMLPVRIQDPFIRKSLYINLLQIKTRLTQHAVE